MVTRYRPQTPGGPGKLAQARFPAFLSLLLLLTACGDSGTDPGPPQGAITLSVEGGPLSLEAGDSIQVVGVERRANGTEAARGGVVSVISGNLSVRGGHFVVGEMPGEGRVRVSLNGRQAEANVTVNPTLPPEVTGEMFGDAGTALEFGARIRGKIEPVTIEVIWQDPDIGGTSVVSVSGGPVTGIQLLAPGSAMLTASYRGSPQVTIEVQVNLKGPAAFLAQTIGADRLFPGGEFEVVGHRVNEISGGFTYDAGPITVLESQADRMRFRLDTHGNGLGCELDPDVGKVTWTGGPGVTILRGGLPGDLRGLGPAETRDLNRAEGCLYLSTGSYAMAFTDRGTWEDIEAMNLPFFQNRMKRIGEDLLERVPMSFALNRYQMSGEVYGEISAQARVLVNRPSGPFASFIGHHGESHGHVHMHEAEYSEDIRLHGNIGVRELWSWEYFKEVGAPYEKDVQYTVYADGNQSDSEGPYWSSFPPHNLKVGDRFRIFSHAAPSVPARGEWAEVHHMSPSGRIVVIVTLEELEEFTEAELSDFRLWIDELEDADEEFRVFFPLDRIGHAHPNEVVRDSTRILHYRDSLRMQNTA